MSEDIDIQPEPNFGELGFVTWDAKQRHIPLDNPRFFSSFRSRTET
jgi:hypothetical protein